MVLLSSLPDIKLTVNFNDSVTNAQSCSIGRSSGINPPNNLPNSSIIDHNIEPIIFSLTKLDLNHYYLLRIYIYIVLSSGRYDNSTNPILSDHQRKRFFKFKSISKNYLLVEFSNKMLQKVGSITVKCLARLSEINKFCTLINN